MPYARPQKSNYPELRWLLSPIFNQTKHFRSPPIFKNFNSSDLGHTKVFITYVGSATSESGLSPSGLEYVMNFRDLST
jgi:hypothetical protein